MRRRTILYAFLALAVPLPALALTDGGEPESDVASIVVSASLDHCGTAAASIVCKIDASWEEVPGATRYTASVTRADGSVVDFGDVGAGSESFYVPYAGNGTYTVAVSAYGTVPDEGEPAVIATGSASAGGGHDGAADETERGGGEPASDAPSPEPGDGGGGETADEESGAEPDDPACSKRDPESERPPGDSPSEAPQGAATEPLAVEAAPAAEEPAEPDPAECPEADPHPSPR